MERIDSWPSQYFASVSILAMFLFWSNQGEYRMQFASIFSPNIASRSGFSLEISINGMENQRISYSLGDSTCVLRKHCLTGGMRFDRFRIDFEKPEGRKHCNSRAPRCYGCIRKRYFQPVTLAVDLACGGPINGNTVVGMLSLFSSAQNCFFTLAEALMCGGQALVDGAFLLRRFKQADLGLPFARAFPVELFPRRQAYAR
jgi:hypothetical protein